MTTVLTRMIARVLLLPILTTAAAVLVKGANSTGDGFSAGLIAATGIVLQYVAFGHEDSERLLPLRFSSGVPVAGVLLALGIAFVPLLAGHAVLTHVPPSDHQAMHLGALALHTAVLFDVGVFFLVFGFTTSIVARIARIRGGGGR
jgi:multisubunit Na+/H+ antiporter MnhB subunit